MELVGTAGFEPTDGGIKNRCLTAWRRPKILSNGELPQKRRAVF